MVNLDSNIIFKINNQIIEKVNQMKYLGVIIDKNLKFKNHIEYICKKIDKNISFFKQIENLDSILTEVNILYIYISKWLNVEQRLKLNTLNFMRRIKNGEAPEYLTE